MTRTTDTTQPNSPLRVALQRWPILVGLGFAAFLAVNLHGGVEVSKVLAASAVVYLGAAAFERRGRPGRCSGRPSSSSAREPSSTSASIRPGRFSPPASCCSSTAWCGARSVRRKGCRCRRSPMLGYGGAAVIALFLNPVAGSYLVAAGLLGHAAWDLYHRLKQRVVSRSMAEFCLALDTASAVTIIVVTAAA